jgi:hypothetical protein
MNLFCGANVSLVLREETLEGVELEPELVPSKQIREAVMNSDHLVRCRKCGRFAIEERATGKLTFLVVEPSPQQGSEVQVP